VPATHEIADKLPAVSGSSGHLKVAPSQTEKDGRTWPGQVFEDLTLSYEEAMLEFVAASQTPIDDGQPDPSEVSLVEEKSPQARKRALQRQEKQLRAQRRQVRQQRKLEDTAWKQARDTHRTEELAYHALSKPERRQQRFARQAREELWQAVREKRRSTVERRKQEDQLWREKRNHLRERISQVPVITAWIAILIVIDNCTRQCCGLPLFVAGSHVTAEMIVEALQILLPPELRFLISDRGTHFKAEVFKKFMLSEEFIHVLIARQRPQSNGIAERFVRTLKEWLEDKAWQDDQQLAELLRQFLDEYNDRPHQGLSIPGLSPNEFAKRIWLM
jgi:transposase InsO family protein